MKLNIRFPGWRRVREKPVNACQRCEWRGRNLKQHLEERHGVPLVVIGQGEYERRIG